MYNDIKAKYTHLSHFLTQTAFSFGPSKNIYSVVRMKRRKEPLMTEIIHSC